MSATQGTEESKPGILQWFMFVAIATVYLCVPTKNYFFDGIDFARSIEDVPAFHPSLFHANHLIYNVVGSAFYRLIIGLGIEIRAINALQILNSILSTLTAYILFLILKSSLRSRYLCFALTLLFAFSATWWKFSTDANAYIPSVLFLLISFYLALPGRKPRPLLVALTYSISLCFHQIAIVFFPVLVVALFVEDGSLTRRRRLAQALVFSGAACLVTLTAYVFSFYLLTRAFQVTNFVRWTMSYSPDESFGFHALNNLGFTLRGHFRLFFGGRFNSLSGLINPFIVLLILILSALLLIFIVQVIRHFKKPDLEWLRALRQNPMRRTLSLLCLFWISLYLIFLYLLLAHHTFYRLFYLPALIILLGLALDSRGGVKKIARTYRLALFVAILGLTNFLMLVFPYSHVQKYPPLAFALELNQTWPQGTIIYYALSNSDQRLIRYFNPGTIWKQLDAKVLTSLEEDTKAAKARGTAVWLETTAIDRISATTEGATWLKQNATEQNQRALVTRAHNIRFIQITSAQTNKY